MAFFKEFNKTVLQKVLPLSMEKDYSIAFHTGGIDIYNLKKTSVEQQNKAIQADWYIRWSYRNPTTKLLVKQNHIKSGVNRIKNIPGRIHFLKAYKKGMIEAFEQGITPYSTTTSEDKNIKKNEHTTAKEAFNTALSLKKHKVNEQTYQDYTGVIDRLSMFLKKQHKLNDDIKKITRKDITDYLNEILKETSARTRNNHRSQLSAIFTELNDSFIIERNFIKTDIKKLRTKKKHDRRMTTGELKQLASFISEQSPHLLLYIKMVSYSFFRGIEVNRLKKESIDLQNKLIFFNQKTVDGKTKFIPEIYFKELAKLARTAKKGEYLFTPNEKPSNWEQPDHRRRDHFTKKFKRLRQKADANINCTIYSFRHYYITSTYVALRVKKKLNKEEAIDQLMNITGHSSKSGILNYIHDNIADKPQDWSELIEVKL